MAPNARDPAAFRSLVALVRAAFSAVLWSVMPRRCCVCGGEVGPDRTVPLCPSCEADVETAAIGPGTRTCPRCGKPLISELLVCTRCRGAEYSFDAATPLFRYRGALRDLILAYKGKGRRSLAPWFAERLSEVLEERYQGWRAIAVPPRPGKRRKVGWDQVEDLARALEARHGVKVDRCLARSAGAEQKALGLAGRAENAKGLYSVQPGAIVPDRVVLIDDVMTTGATLSACAAALKAAGANAVAAIILAAD